MFELESFKWLLSTKRWTIINNTIMRNSIKKKSIMGPNFYWILSITTVSVIVIWPSIYTNGQLVDHTEFDPSNIFNESELIEDINDNPRCQPMRIPMCEDIGYNMTILPNRLRHQSQADVISEINIYHPLIKLGCSPDLRLFLCSIYAPICFDKTDGPVRLLPCRALCESARKGCSSYFQQFNTAWPPAFKCEQFPERNSGNPDCIVNISNHLSSNNLNDGLESHSSPSVIRDLGFVCPKNFEVPSYTLYLNGTNYSNCAKPCLDVFLDKNSAQIVRISAATLSIVSLALTLFTIITYFSNIKRSKFPSKPIVIITGCQFVVALCYLMGFLTNNEIACDDPLEPPKSLPNLSMIRATTMGNKKGSCTLQFMALYFFQLSTMFWWLMMTISWFMIARLKWAPEAVSGVSRYFHFISWTIPALLTFYLAVLGNIEGDSSTGTCYVTYTDQQSTYTFVMYPIFICTLAGCLFLTIGFKSLWETRDSLKRDYGQQTDEHHKLIIKFALFSMLFILCSVIFLYCHYIQQTNMNSWMLSWVSRACKSRDYSMPCPMRNSGYQKPHYFIYVLKIVATLGIGILSALFMLSEKSLSSFKEVAEMCNYKH